MDATLDRLARRRASGYVQVAQDGYVVYERALGYRNFADLLPNTASTSFQLGSVSKQFTAVAILQLWRAGELDLESRVGEHFPAAPETAAAATIHQLLTHTAGLVEYASRDFIATQSRRVWSTFELLEHIWMLGSRFSPGRGFEYSNSNYVVLAALVEKISGQAFAQYMQERVFSPAGLCETQVEDARLEERAQGYRVRDSQLTLVQGVNPSVALGAGDVRSSPNDLLRWHLALQGDAVIPREEKWRLYQWTPSRYAYGWVVKRVGDVAIVSHTGSIGGFRSEYVRIPALDISISALSNNQSVALSEAVELATELAMRAEATCG